MAEQKNRHARVGALSDAQRAIRSQEQRVRNQRHTAKLQGQGLKQVLSAASKVHKKALDHTQRQHVNGKPMWVKVVHGSPSAAQLAEDATAARLLAAGEAAEHTYLPNIHGTPAGL
jgi:hypothetical protein